MKRSPAMSKLQLADLDAKWVVHVTGIALRKRSFKLTSFKL